MSEKNKTLTDLLHAARTEPAQEFVSTSDAQRLVANSIMRDVPSVMERLQTRLFSTPLRLSITAMTSAALITLATLGVRSFLPSSTPQITQLPQLAQFQHQPPQVTAVAVDSNREGKHAGKVETELRFIPRRAQASSNPVIPVTPVVPSVPTVEATPAQLEMLGISLDDSGGIVCQFPREEIRFGDNGNMRFEAGLMPKDSSTLWREPHLVTSPNGSKRFFSYVSFSKDTAIEQISANGKKMKISVKVEERTIVSNDSEASELAKAHGQTATIKMFANHDRPLDLQFDSTLPRGKVALSLSSFSDSNIAYRNDSSIVFKNMETVKSKILIGKGGKARIIINSDSSQIQPLKDAIVAIQRRDSSRNGKSMDEVIKEFGSHIANSRDNNANSTDQDHARLAFQQLASELNRQASTAPNIDKLIPVLVRNTKNAAHPNELIFWYEPLPEITNLLPAQKQNGAVRMAQNFSVSVFPNPTSGPAQITYTMKDAAHHADFVIRNLLGQKVMDAGSSDGTSGNISLDLSKLDAGLYLLVTTTDDGEQSVERIVVNK